MKAIRSTLAQQLYVSFDTQKQTPLANCANVKIPQHKHNHPSSQTKILDDKTQKSYYKNGKDVSFHFKTLMDHPYSKTKDRLRKFLADNYDIEFERRQYSIDEMRKLVREATKAIGESGIIPFWDIEKDPSKFACLYEIVSEWNHDVAVKLVVQWNLWGSTVLRLGTERHMKFLKPTSEMKLFGCFGLTELRGGSNVAGTQTRATYDENSKEFIIETPQFEDQKYWIGGGAEDASHCAVFARLIHRQKDLGIHCFVVPIRKARGSPIDKVTTRDIGFKLGYNGIDNGGILFKGIRVPRENLLNKFSDIKPDGTYVSSISNPRRLFGATLGTLVFGRIVIGTIGLSAAKVSLAVAIRFSTVRRQFGTKNSDNLSSDRQIPLIEYPTQQRRLLEPLARCISLDLVLKELGLQFSKTETDIKAGIPGANARFNFLHIMAAGLKAETTWFGTKTALLCREACGGQGFRRIARFAHQRESLSMLVTGEGDNTVMLRAIAKYFLTLYFRHQQTGSKGKLAPAVADLLKTPQFTTSFSLNSPYDQIEILGQFSGSSFTQLVKSVSCSLSKNGNNILAALNTNLNAACDFARLYVDYFIHQILVKDIAYRPHSTIQNIFADVVVANGLFSIQTHIKHFIGFPISTNPHMKKVDSLLEARAKKLLPYCLALVESFGIPEKFLPPSNLINADSQDLVYRENL